MIDIGVNLTSSQFAKDRPEVVQQSFASGIEAMVLTGTDLEGSRKSRQICQDFASQYPGQLFSTAGVHPHDASGWNTQVATEIAALLEAPEVVAVGETGLDFNRNFSTPAEQIKAFEAQIELACNSGLPIFLHERDAFETQIDILRNYRDQYDRAVIHCFTGSKKALYAYLDLDLYIGITGWVCDERRGLELARLVADIPLQRLMLETDAPYLLPRNIQPKPGSRRNEPRYLTWVVEKVAQCYGLNAAEIARQTSQNARDFFNLPAAADS